MVSFALIICGFLLAGLDIIGANSADDLVDEVLMEVIAKYAGDEPIPLPHFHETFKTKVAFITVKGEATGDDGYLKNLSTLVRTSPVQIDDSDSSFSVALSLSLEKLEIGFKEFHAKAAFIGLHGNLRMHIRKNDIYIKMTVNFNDDGSCKTDLTDLKVNKLDDFSFHLAPMDQRFNWLLSFVAKLIANSQSQHFAGVLTDKLTVAIKEALLKHEICDKLPTFGGDL